MKPKFPILPLDQVDKRLWRTRKKVIVNVNGIRIEVPKYFQTDLASVPRWLWSFIAPTGYHNRAALVHDYLYSTGEYSRSMCDRIFLILLISDNSSIVKSLLMYLGVRLGGKKFYKPA